MSVQLVKGARIRIIGDHPHRGEAGTVVEFDVRVGLWRLKMDDSGPGIGGVDECFADRHNLRGLSADEDPYA